MARCPRCGGNGGVKLLKEVAICNKCVVKDADNKRISVGLTSKDLGVIEDFEPFYGQPTWKLLRYPKQASPPKGWIRCSWYTSSYGVWGWINKVVIEERAGKSPRPLNTEMIGGIEHMFHGMTVLDNSVEYHLLYEVPEEER